MQGCLQASMMPAGEGVRKMKYVIDTIPAMYESLACMVTSAWRPTGPTARLTPLLTPQCMAPAKAETAALRAHHPLSANVKGITA